VGSHLTKKGALDSQLQVYQLLAHGRWFSPSTLASSTTKTGRHDIAEILLKVALKHNKSNQIKLLYYRNNFVVVLCYVVVVVFHL
jgi:hypothetical protein